MTKLGTALARLLRIADGLLATLVGFALLLTGIVGGAASAAGHEFASPPTVAIYAH